MIASTPRRIGAVFRSVDAALRTQLREQRAPLILAGVQYLLPIYREVSGYGPLAHDEVPGNPDHLSEHELHARTRPWFRPTWSRLGRMRSPSTGSWRARASSDDLSRIVSTAQQGQIESLFIDRTAHRWGTFDAASGQLAVRSSSAREAGDDDLLDYAAVQTLLHRGAVYALPAEQVPAPPAAAILRYNRICGKKSQKAGRRSACRLSENASPAARTTRARYPGFPAERTGIRP